MTEKAIVRFNPKSGWEFENIDDMFRAADCFLQSGFAPKGFQMPQQLVVCWARAAELGIKPLQAVDGMSVINNRLGIGGDMALALVRSKGLLVQSPRTTYTGDGDTLKCTVELHRKGDDEPREFSYSVAEAKQANIYHRSDAWKGYPRRMTYYRALGFGMRDLFGDVLKGMVTSEELHDYPDLLESDKAKVAASRARSAEARAAGEEFVHAPQELPTVEEATEPAFEENKKPDAPPFARELERDFAEQELDDIDIGQPAPVSVAPVAEPPPKPATPPPPEPPKQAPPQPGAKRPEWMDYTIKTIPHRRFFGKRISELEAADLTKIETQWIPKIEQDMENASTDQRVEYKHFQSAIAHGKLAKPF
jgi:hypothetical protein